MVIDVKSKEWWTDEYVAGRLAAGKEVPKHRLAVCVARQAGIVRPLVCPRCGAVAPLYLTKIDLAKPIQADNLVYRCGACRGRVLKEYNRQNRRPPGRPKKVKPEIPEIPAPDLAKLYWEYQKSLPVPTMDD